MSVLIKDCYVGIYFSEFIFRELPVITSIALVNILIGKSKNNRFFFFGLPSECFRILAFSPSGIWSRICENLPNLSSVYSFKNGSLILYRIDFFFLQGSLSMSDRKVTEMKLLGENL